MDDSQTLPTLRSAVGDRLDCREITVTFGDFVALDGVSARFEPGRIHALVGQNGAGKTTLARVIAGLVEPSGGEVVIGESHLPGGDVKAARQAGIEMVHQSFALPPSMTVAEALEYGSTARGRLFSRRALNDRWQRYLDDIGVAVSAKARLSTLPIETLQAVEIARALSGDASTLILDEPTAVLPPESVGQLFDRMRALRDRGVTIIMVLHKAREVLEIAETVTVLRRGKLILAAEPVEAVTPARFAEAIIGEAPAAGGDDLSVVGLDGPDGAAHPAPAVRGAARSASVTFSGVSTKGGDGGPGLRSLSTSLYPGEIVGIAGVEGNGQVALAETIAGLQAVESGELEIAGSRADHLSPLQRRARGVRIIPFERNTEGLSTSTALWQNWAVPRMVGGSRRFFINPRALRADAEKAFADWDVRFSSATQKASELSGGNAQKVILSRELDEDAAVIVAAQPTRGLDLGATEFVWTALRRARDRGATIVLISSDLDELEAISDRILVLLGGELVLDAAPPYRTQELGTAMTGIER